MNTTKSQIRMNYSVGDRIIIINESSPFNYEETETVCQVKQLLSRNRALVQIINNMNDAEVEFSVCLDHIEHLDVHLA